MTTSVKVTGKIEINKRINPNAIKYTRCSECNRTIVDNGLNIYTREQIINGKLLNRKICIDCHNSGGELDDLYITGRTFPHSIFE